MREFTVGKNDAGKRLDKLLARLMPQLPPAMLYKGLRKDCVRVNGRHVRDGAYKTVCGDVLTLYFKDEFFEKSRARGGAAVSQCGRNPFHGCVRRCDRGAVFPGPAAEFPFI